MPALDRYSVLKNMTKGVGSSFEHPIIPDRYKLNQTVWPIRSEFAPRIVNRIFLLAIC